MRKQISLIVTDLDNTLWDWFEIWYRPFKVMLDKVVELSEIGQAQIEKEFKRIHQKYGTSEYTFSIEELPSLKQKHSKEVLLNIYSEAISEYRKERSRILKLYPFVKETLGYLKERGCIIIAYTESLAYYSKFRIIQLGLDGLIDQLYTPPNPELPKNIPEKIINHYREQSKLSETIHIQLESTDLKPNPNLLRQIITQSGGTNERTIYIGDSLMKDIYMAQEAEILDVYAKYGVVTDRPEYELLRRVTHWKDEDVKKEKRLHQKDIHPTYILENSFKELLDLFHFTEHKT